MKLDKTFAAKKATFKGIQKHSKFWQRAKGGCRPKICANSWKEEIVKGYTEYKADVEIKYWQSQ